MTAWFDVLLIFFGIAAGQFSLLLLHEFGHVVPILATGGTAKVTVGRGGGRTVQFGPVEFAIGLATVRSLFTYGTVEWTGVESNRVQAIAILSGPLTSLTMVLVFAATLLRGVEPPAYWIFANLALLETWRLYQTLVPKTYSRGAYEGMPSDGMRFLRLIRS